MAQSFFVSLTPHDAEERIYQAVVGGSVTGEAIDRFQLSGQGGDICLVSIFEKHYWRAGNRLTLTVTVDNLQGHTRVHLVSGGGGEGLFRFDWGASEALCPVRSTPLSRTEFEEVLSVDIRRNHCRA